MQDKNDKFVPMNTTESGGHQTYIAPAAAAAVFIPKHARGILIQAVTQNVRYTLDGTNPTATKGYQLQAGDPPLYIELDHRITLKVVREVAGAVLEYEFNAVDNSGTLG